MIKVNKIELQTVEAFDPNDKSLGFVNYFQFQDLRIQIMEEKATGYYIIFKDKKYKIEANGRIYEYPLELFSLLDDQLDKLLNF